MQINPMRFPPRFLTLPYKERTMRIHAHTLQQRMERAATIEITILSAEELRRLGNTPTFVAVRPGVGGDVRSSQTVVTGIDCDGGRYPRWNEKMRLALPPSSRSITVEVCCRPRGGGRARRVAAAEVPVSDFRWPEDYLHLLSYRLREADGRANGIVNFSVRVLGGGARECNNKPQGGFVTVGYPVGY
ncbi:hypothetical protein ZIOFF_017791 [Zingiber officinale]|uniref:C2 domain-containing protein n=2 Tax=Zingiber officinale TaxID=94328 RepID=A0A8J5HUZ5_ZINOF|nr:hypothetical protein ZIOFF_017791 [Zingiber officinale]